jgi:hypothetical protein
MLTPGGLLLAVSAAVIPIHYTLRANLSGMGITRSQLMQLTIAALPSSSPVMWCAGGIRYKTAMIYRCSRKRQFRVAVSHQCRGADQLQQ